MNNREIMLHLMCEHQITQKKAAELICIQTMRPCSVRAIKSWVNDPDKPSSRTCPDWAVKALTMALEKE
ncbi:hypothetical protein VKM53_20335 [Providencia stuartii]|uniref:hypothetical protein n=1 Tax=Enterobacterales TaxID=91347 RepID=UPI0023B07CB4|nr:MULTISPECIES: hypothetical protein [Enterobacterales]MEB3134711.1 hypothetical protein [Providencia stuartii]